MLGHAWIVIVLVVLVVLVIAGPRMLPRLGSRVGRTARETKVAAVEATANLMSEARGPAEPPVTDGDRRAGTSPEVTPPGP